jgi:hypothetical protein
LVQLLLKLGDCSGQDLGGVLRRGLLLLLQEKGLDLGLQEEFGLGEELVLVF